MEDLEERFLVHLNVVNSARHVVVLVLAFFGLSILGKGSLPFCLVRFLVSSAILTDKILRMSHRTWRFHGKGLVLLAPKAKGVVVAPEGVTDECFNGRNLEQVGEAIVPHVLELSVLATQELTIVPKTSFHGHNQFVAVSIASQLHRVTDSEPVSRPVSLNANALQTFPMTSRIEIFNFSSLLLRGRLLIEEVKSALERHHLSVFSLESSLGKSNASCRGDSSLLLGDKLHSHLHGVHVSL